MSGNIRKAIGLTKRRLEDAIQSYETIREQLEISPENFDDDQLYNLYELVDSNFEKIRKYVQRLETLEKQWTDLIQADPTEAEIRAEYIAKYGDYLKVLDVGRSAADHLRRRILRLREAVQQRLDIGDTHEDPVSEGTMTNLPKNEEVFSTPQRSRLPSGATTPTTQATDQQKPGSLNKEVSIEPIIAPNWTDMLFLPSVTIPIFNGNPSKWMEFFDLFSAMIDKRQLEPCIKLFHLRSHLDGEAKASISHLGNSNEDYTIAMKTLKDLYGDPLRVTHRLRSEVLHFKLNTTNAVGLYKGWARLNQLYSQLLSMGDPADTTLLGQVIEAKFPRHILQKVYKTTDKILKGKEMLEELGNILRREANLDRLISDNKAEFLRPNQEVQRKASNNQPNHYFTHFNNANSNQMDKDQCHLCDGHHKTYQCDKYKEPRERSRRVRERKLCLNCLRPGHQANQCPSKRRCRHCEKAHHSTICFRNEPGEAMEQQRSSNSNNARRVTFPNRDFKLSPTKATTNSRSKPTASNTRPKSMPKPTNNDNVHSVIEIEGEKDETHACLSHASTTQDSVLLMTTQASASNPNTSHNQCKVTVFLDNGSTKSYITEDLAAKLQLKPKSTELLRVSTFGNQEINTRRTNTYELKLQDLHHSKDSNITINVIALPHLTNLINTARLDNAYSESITVSKVKPDVLIGMDNWKVVNAIKRTMTLPSGFNMAHSTIGTVIYGKGKIQLTALANSLETYHAYNANVTSESDENEQTSDGEGMESEETPSPSENKENTPPEMLQNISEIPLPTMTPTTSSETKERDPPQSGTIQLILGPARSGKTSQLLHIMDDLPTQTTKLLITHINESIAMNNSGNVAKHSKTRELKETIDEILEQDYIFIDEVHLFNDAPEVLHFAAFQGKHIIATGIHVNNNQEPLQNMARLIAKADKVTILEGKCQYCQAVTPFTILQDPIQTDPSDVKQWVKAKNKHITLCRKCIIDGPTEATYCNAQEDEIDEEIVLYHDESHPEVTLFSDLDIDDEDDTKDKLKRKECELQKSLNKFWAVEHLGILDDPRRNDDDIAMEAFLKSITRDSQGRYVCSWPWRLDPADLPSNFGRALGRLKSTVKRLKQRPDLFEQYDKIFKEQLQDGIIEIVPKGWRDGPIHYLAHQAVETPEKQTTKLRVVFDASCKTSNGKSLNDYLFRGPVLLPNLVDMLIKFRATSIPWLSDIQRAFHQLSLKTSDRDCVRFLWIKDPNLPPEGDNLITCRFTRVIFGSVSSPFLLGAVADYHLQHYPHPLAQKMRQTSYVDNILIPNDTVEQAINSYHESRRIFAEASMNLREFQTSHPVLKEFLQKEGTPVPDMVKVLGLCWDTNDDMLSIKPVKEKDSTTEVHSKRRILQLIAQVYDPLGMITPMTAQAKRFMQHLWMEKHGWDDPLTPTELNTWRQIYDELKNVYIPRLPRKLFPDGATSQQLHLFCDASQDTYSAVAYLRIKGGDNIDVKFLMGKSRVRPLKEITIPRLELMANLIASTMAKNLKEALSDKPIEQIYLWTDSRIALAWLHSQRTLPTFVRNRVTTIWQNVPEAKFQYVPTNINPADCATRDIKASEFAKSSWLTGPKWLKEDENKWPKQPTELPDNPEDITAATNVEQRNDNSGTLLDFTRFSTWSRAVNTFVNVMLLLYKKFTNSITQKTANFGKLLQYFAPNNDVTTKFTQAELMLFKMIQQEAPPDNKRIKELNLFKDNNQLYRCQTRLTHSDLHPETVAPIYLPKSTGTRLYILHVHNILGHSSPITTLCSLRQRVWIPKARTFVKSTIHTTCLACRQPQPFKLPNFPAYPTTRMRPTPAFNFTGVDYAGPIQVKTSTKTKEKAWICLFTCLTSRSVHLELVLDLTTASLLQALRRFISRRGAPAEIWSDQATNFKAIGDVLTKAWAESEEAQHYLAARGIKWNYITEAAPWTGGVWERMIGIMKSSLKKAIGKKILTPYELTTVLTEVEALVNSRPLTYVPSDETTHVIRPIDCIQPGARLGVPILEPWEDSETYEDRSTLTNKLIDLWRKQQDVLNRFWTIWNEEYLLTLAERTQTEHKQTRSAIKRTPIPGEVIMIHDPDISRGNWKIAKVLEVVKPTKIKLQLENGTILHRSPKLLYPLELNPDPPDTKKEMDNKVDADDEMDSNDEEPGQQDDKPTLRRSARLKAKTTRTYFTDLIILSIFTLLVSPTTGQTTSSGAVQEASNPKLTDHTTTVSTPTTTTQTTCNADQCAPWRYECCTNVQRTGMFLWFGLLITLIPTFLFIGRVILLLLKFVIKVISLIIRFTCRKATGRRPAPEIPHERKRSLRRLIERTKATGLALLAFLLLTKANGCSETAHLMANSTDCTLDDETMIETCAIKQTIQVALRPIGDTTCIRIHSANSNNSELLEITTKGILAKCNYKYWYDTRDYKLDVESVFRCRHATSSNCFQDWCENTEGQTDVNEFSDTVRKAPGYSHCERTCNCCNGCGCQGAACLFWRIYAQPSSGTTYEVGECPTWEVRVNLETKFRNATREDVLVAAQPTQIWAAKLTLQSFSLPPVPILGKQFIYNRETKKAMIGDASKPNQPVAGTIGTMQCSTPEQAKNGLCSFPREICECSTDSYQAKCYCNYKNVMDFEGKPDYALPLTSGPVTIKRPEFTNDYWAYATQSSSILLHASFENVSLSVREHSTKCDVKVTKQVEGCRDCNTGATAQIQCLTKLPTTIAITCKDQNIILPCNNDLQTLTINSRDENYDALCTYQCSKTNGSFRLQGHLGLVTVDPPLSQQVGTSWLKPATSIPFSKIFSDALDFVTGIFKSILHFLIDNPIMIILIIIAGFILLCVLKTFVFPGIPGANIVLPKIAQQWNPLTSQSTKKEQTMRRGTSKENNRRSRLDQSSTRYKVHLH